MKKKAFEQLMTGMKEVLANVKGEPKALAGARVTRFPITQADVKRTRQRLGLSQEEFARGFCISLGTLRHWEQGLRKPEGPARVLLTLIDRDPQLVIAAIWPDTERAEKFKRVKERVFKNHAATFKKLAEH